MYSYLATLRLHDGYGGQTLTVGPQNRVVFKDRIITPPSHRYADLRKDELKLVLSPLRKYWGEDQPEKLKGRQRDLDRPVMTFSQFKGAARRLLTDAGMMERPTEE